MFRIVPFVTIWLFSVSAFAGPDSDARRAALGSARWSQLAWPASRLAATMSHDPVGDRLVLFGGLRFGTTLGDTWMFDLADPAADWRRLEGPAPPARQLHSMIYDPLRRRMLVFGGAAPGVSAGSNDTWALSLDGTPIWSAVTPLGSPPEPRVSHSAVYDPIEDRMLVFGGYTASLQHYNDVWSLNLAGTPTWSRLATSGRVPPESNGHAAVFDSVHNRMIVFAVGRGYSNEVWVLGLSGTPTWSKWTPQGAWPSARMGSALALDAIRERLVVFGGYDGLDLNDTWELSVGAAPAWRRLAPADSLPAARRFPAATHDRRREAFVIFGGYGNQSGFFSGAWTLGLADAPRWWPLGPHGQPPSPRYGHAGAYDSKRDRLVVFGGFDGDDRNDTHGLWFDPPRWDLVSVSGDVPVARYGHSVVYDPVGDRVLVFGGCGVGGCYTNEVWSLSFRDGPVWSRIEPAGELPPGRIYHNAIYDVRRRRMVVFGGLGSIWNERFRNDVWALSLDGVPIWERIEPTGAAPQGRDFATCIYDPNRDQMVLYGGEIGRAEVWTLSFEGVPVWRQRTVTGSPQGRYQHTAIFDPIRDVMVVMGGKGSSVGRDVWCLTLDGMAWTRPDTSGSGPTNRARHVAVYDPIRDRMVFFGGQPLTDDTWALSWGEPVKPAVQCALASNAFPGFHGEATVHVSSPIEAPRAIQWDVSSERPWPGFPLHGVSILGGAGSETIIVPLTVPDTAGFGPNRLRVGVAFAGAAGNESSCEHPVHVDVATPVLASVVSRQVSPGGVRIVWRVAPGRAVTVWRRVCNAPWSLIVTGIADETGHVSHEDREVLPGACYDYALQWQAAGETIVAGEARVLVPGGHGLTLVGACPNPGAGGVNACFALPREGQAVLELYDVQGRRVARRRVTLAAGAHAEPITAREHLSAGRYVLRLIFEGERLDAPIVVQ